MPSGIVVAIAIALAIAAVVRQPDPAGRAIAVRRAGLGLVALFTFVFGAFITGETFAGLGGWKPGLPARNSAGTRPGPGVQAAGDAGEIFSGVHRQVGALGQVLQITLLPSTLAVSGQTGPHRAPRLPVNTAA